MAKRILIVDDEPLIVKGLRISLEQDGYEVDTAADGIAGLEKIMNGQPDLVLLDVMLPGMDGMEVCRQAREVSSVPIIMLTAKGEDMDKILGLEYGADDYMTKPFNILEVKARIRTILRRTQQSAAKPADTQVLTIGTMTVNLSNRSVRIRGQEVNLTAKEFDLLKLFITNPGRVFTREELLEQVWKYDFLGPGELRTVDVHIRRLREKVETTPSTPEYICTKWGYGYFFKEQ